MSRAFTLLTHDALAHEKRSGDIVVLHQPWMSSDRSQPSAYLLTTPTRGHADVVRSMHHDILNEAIYTGCEDGVLCAWSLAGLPRLIVGDLDIDDDGGDGRENVASDDERDEESEIETESESETSEIDEDVGLDGVEGPRHGPVLGGGREKDGRKEKRRDKRALPY